MNNTNSKKTGDYKYTIYPDLVSKVRKFNAQYDDCNLRFWGDFHWYKNHAGGKVSLGSISPSSPVHRNDAEYILIWVKNQKKLENIHGVNFDYQKSSVFSPDDRDKYLLTRDEYYKFTLQTWQIPACTDKKLRHPAKFHKDIPHRLIKLLTWPQDLILDCWSGSGTVCATAKRLKRNYIGIDQNPAYCEMSRLRCQEVS